MIRGLRVFFGVVLLSLLAACVYASNQRALWDLPAEVARDPWFLATLLDAYWGFLVFWLWVAYRETSVLVRLAWLLALLLSGNMAVAVYMLWRLGGMEAGDSPEKLLLRDPRGGAA